MTQYQVTVLLPKDGLVVKKLGYNFENHKMNIRNATLVEFFLYV